MKNLVLNAGSESSGFAGKDSELFWSIGVLECWQERRSEFQLESVFSLLQYSTTPSLHVICKDNSCEADSGSGRLFMPSLVVEYLALAGRQYLQETGEGRKAAHIKLVLHLP